MLSQQKLYELATRWEILLKNRPSTTRNHLIFWVLRIVFDIVIIACAIIISTTFFKEMWLPIFQDLITEEDAEAINELFIFFRVILTIIAGFSAIIVWLAVRGLHRNSYIDQLEDLVDEYHNAASGFTTP